MTTRGGSFPSRVSRLERVQRRHGGTSTCAVCGGAGFPGVFVQDGEGAELGQVGEGGCAGCGRVRVGAVVVLPGGGEWCGGEGADRR